MPTPTPPSARDYIQDLTTLTRAGGRMTQRQIAAQLGRSPDLISRISRGLTPGHNLTGALAELAGTGTVTTIPPRRRGKDGALVRVRAPGGRTHTPTEPTPTPPPPTTTPAPAPAPTQDEPGGQDPEQQPPTTGPRPPLPPGRAGGGSRITYFAGGRRLIEVTAPKTEGLSRERGRAAVLDGLRSAARSQAQARKHAAITVTTAGGRTATIGSKGGYQVSTLLAGMRGEGDDPYGWLSQEFSGLPDTSNSAPLDLSDPIVDVRINIW